MDFLTFFSDLAIDGEFENFNAGLETFGLTFSEPRRDSLNLDRAVFSFAGVAAPAGFELESMGKFAGDSYSEIRGLIFFHEREEFAGFTE